MKFIGMLYLLGLATLLGQIVETNLPPEPEPITLFMIRGVPITTNEFDINRIELEIPQGKETESTSTVSHGRMLIELRNITNATETWTFHFPTMLAGKWTDKPWHVVHRNKTTNEEGTVRSQNETINKAPYSFEIHDNAVEDDFLASLSMDSDILSIRFNSIYPTNGPTIVH